MRRWITSMRESGGSLGLDGTSAREAEPISSTPVEVRVVRWPTGTKDRRTTFSVATTAPPEPTRALSKEALSTIPAESEQMEGGQRPKDGPKDNKMRPASTQLDLEPARCIEEAWYSLKWQTDLDGDDGRSRRSPQIPLAKGTIPWEEPGRDDWAGPPELFFPRIYKADREMEWCSP